MPPSHQFYAAPFSSWSVPNHSSTVQNLISIPLDRLWNCQETVVHEQEGLYDLGNLPHRLSLFRRGNRPPGRNLLEQFPFISPVGTTKDGCKDQGRRGNPVHSNNTKCGLVLLRNRLSAGTSVSGVPKGELSSARLHRLQ